MKPPQETFHQDARETLESLESTSVKAILANGLGDWEARSDRFGFATPLPAKPLPPAVPEAPVFGPPPREEDARYQVELTTLDRFFSSRRIKKQQAVLKRFEKDRKAWNENRSYALAVYEQAQKRHAEAVTTLESGYEEVVGRWKQDFEVFLRDLVQRAA